MKSSLLDEIHFTEITKFYIIPPICFITVITNSLCFVIFVKIIKSLQRRSRNSSTNLMFKYLLMKSVCDILPGLFNIIIPAFVCSKCRSSSSFIMQIWFIYFNQFLSEGFYLASGCFEIVASINCAISIDKQMKWCENKITFILINIVITLLSFGIFSIYFKIYSIYGVETTMGYTNYTLIINETIVDYEQRKIIQNNYYINFDPNYVNIYININKIEVILRDVIVVGVLFVINVYIIIKLVLIRRMKHQLQSNATNSDNTSQNRASQRAENRRIKMIIFMFIVYFFGHFPTIFQIFFIRRDYILELVGLITLYASYSSSLFVYLLFNNQFKVIFLNTFKLTF
jgi:hypothetical protein